MDNNLLIGIAGLILAIVGFFVVSNIKKNKTKITGNNNQKGMSLDHAEIDLSQAFIHGMGYVALSRVRTLAGIKLMGLNKIAMEVNPAITEFDKELKDKSKESHQKLKVLNWIKKKKAHGAFLMRSLVTR